MNKYFYKLLARYIGLYVLPHNTVVEIDPKTDLLIRNFPRGAVAFRESSAEPDSAGYLHRADIVSIRRNPPDYFLLNGLIHYERDIQSLMHELYRLCDSRTRIIIVYYSSLWKPLMNLASRFGWRRKMPEQNWLMHQDIDNLLTLENFEIIRRDNKFLLPIHIPLISRVVNRYLAPLPFFRLFSLANIVVARPLIKIQKERRPSVSIVVPVRNEAGNIEDIVRRTPQMGPDDELIFVEGHSKDDTWSKVCEVYERYRTQRSMVAVQQDGEGKGDAVRKGFHIARNEILMILDADLTVAPEDLVKFYDAITSGKGEFINGSRLVYPMEKRAMRFANLVGNKFFATAFSFVLGQRFKDTLCGTKVLSKENYEKLAQNRSYFGEFDSFGDFDLIFGASRMCLKFIEVPINYHERTYGETNISRWRHGFLLLVMLLFASRKIKFI